MIDSRGDYNFGSVGSGIGLLLEEVPKYAKVSNLSKKLHA